MLDNLETEAREAASPLLERWSAFAGKVSQRADDVVAEARAGLDEIVGMNAVDANAIAAGMSAVESRFRGLQDKVEQAVSKLEEDWEEATEDLEVSDREQAALRLLWSQLVNQSRALMRDIERKGELVSIENNADWGRALHQLAEREWSEPRECGNCAAAIDVPIKHATASVNCAHCGAVNSIEVGIATGLYFSGTGVHNLAREAAKDQGLAEWEAEHRFNELRHPTEPDRQRYHDAARAYWAAYYTAFMQLHPGFPRTLEEAVAAKLAHYEAYNWSSEQRQRDLIGEVVRLAAAGDRADLIACLRAGKDVDLDDMACAVHERGDQSGARLLLDIQYEMEDEDEPRDAWLAEKLAELDEDLANR